MSRYNLIDEKWIPLRMLDGSYCQLGIAETLSRAKEIDSIEDQSPLVVASIYRLLLALLYRALEGPTDVLKAKHLFKEGLPKEKIEAYLLKWRDRFWLFDEKYPFGQIPTFMPETMRAWTVLTAEHNADNAKVLSDHVNVLSAGKISAAKAICGILATQTFSVSSGKSELAHTGTAPSATAMMVLPMGINLEDTLIFSLVDQSYDLIQDDLPLWEREPETVSKLKSGIERSACGFADLYTWRTRSIRLQEDADGDVENVAFASGVKYNSPDMVDPMLAYRKDDKLGRLPIQFRERGFWRDFDCILPDDSKLAPQIIHHIAKLIRSNSARQPKSIMILGQSNNKAKIEFWRMERFILPEAIAGEETFRYEIRHLLNTAEGASKILWKACEVFVKHLLSRDENREPAKEDIIKFINGLECSTLYWSLLEANFHNILSAFTLDRDMDEVAHKWNQAVRSALKHAWKQQESIISLDNIWELRAFIKANNVFYFNLNRAPVTSAIKEYELRNTLKEVK